MAESGLTQAQRDALDEVDKLLGEQFDAFVLSYETEASDNTDTIHAVSCKGSFSTLLGLCDRAKDRFMIECRNSITEDEDD